MKPYFMKKSFLLIAVLALLGTQLMIGCSSPESKTVYDDLNPYEVRGMIDSDTLYKDMLPSVFEYKSKLDTNDKVLLSELTRITYDDLLEFYAFTSDTGKVNSLSREIEKDFFEDVKNNKEDLTEMINKRLISYKKLVEENKKNDTTYSYMADDNVIPTYWSDFYNSRITIKDITNPINYLAYEKLLCDVLDRPTREEALTEEYEDMFGENVNVIRNVLKMKVKSFSTPRAHNTTTDIEEAQGLQIISKTQEMDESDDFGIEEDTTSIDYY